MYREQIWIVAVIEPESELFKVTIKTLGTECTLHQVADHHSLLLCAEKENTRTLPTRYQHHSSHSDVY